MASANSCERMIIANRIMSIGNVYVRNIQYLKVKYEFLFESIH